MSNVLNRVNYKTPPESITKKEGFTAVGQWKTYQTTMNTAFDPLKPSFVVLMDTQVVIDIDRPKDGVELPPLTVEDAATFAHEYHLPWPTYCVQTGHLGLHLYYETDITPQQTQKGNQWKGYDIDTRAGGKGLLYGEGTHWKDTQTYLRVAGDPTQIAHITQWNYDAAMYGATYVYTHKLQDFLDGTLNVHKNAGVKNEFIYWREAMFYLKGLGFTFAQVQGVFSHLPGYDLATCTAQMNVYWDKEADPKRVRFSKQPYIMALTDTATPTGTLVMMSRREAGELLAPPTLRPGTPTTPEEDNDEDEDLLLSPEGTPLPVVGEPMFLPPRSTRGLSQTYLINCKTRLLNQARYVFDTDTAKYYQIDAYRVKEVLLPSLIHQGLMAATGRLYTTRKGNELVTMITHQITQKDFLIGVNSAPGYIPFSNGCVNVRTGQLETNPPEVLYTHWYAFPYDPTPVTCPADWASFAEMFASEEDWHWFEAYCFYLLTPDISLQTAPVLVGPGGCGKTTLMEVVTRFVLNTTTQSVSELVGDRASVAALRDKLLCYCDEMGNISFDTKGINLLKVLLTNTILAYRKLHENPVNYHNVTRFVFTANHLPPDTDKLDGAFFSRLKIMTLHMPTTPRIQGFGTHIDIPTIVHYLIQTYRSPAVRLLTVRQNATVQQHNWQQQTGPFEDFFRENVMLADENMLPCSEAIAYYQKYHDPKANVTSFGRQMAQKGFPSTIINVKLDHGMKTFKAYAGIYLREPAWTKVPQATTTHHVHPPPSPNEDPPKDPPIEITDLFLPTPPK